MQREVRKTISVVFSDVVGSTALAERLDPESLHTAMSRYFDLARGIHEQHGGTVEKFIGDAVVAVFGVPQVHEDDALRAVRAADELREAMAELNRELEQELRVTLDIRTGVNTGQALASDEQQGHAFVSGDPVNVAARLQQAAPTGEILLAETTYRLVADAVQIQPIGPVLLSGRSAPVDAYRLLKVTPDAPGLSRHLDTPLIGRTHELAVLRQALDRVICRRACELISVLGDPGVGKSRLLRAFAEQAGERAILLRVNCSSSEETTTAQILREFLGQALPTGPSGGVGRRPADAAELAAERPVAFCAARQLLGELAMTRPVVVVVDDLHWAEPALLDLVEYLHAFIRHAMLLLVVAARRQFLDHRHWQTVGRIATTLVLEPLPEAEAAALAVQLHLPGELRPGMAARIAAWAEGNPLFVEELLRSDGADPDQLGGAAAAPDQPKEAWMPPAVEALLAAELDHLRWQERSVLELASVVGRVFDWPSVAALAPARLRPQVGTVLLALTRRNLIRVADGGRGNDAFSFRHGLLRAVIYRAIPKRQRAVLHMRVAELTAEAGGRSIFEDDEAVDHLEQSYHYLAQLGGYELPASACIDRLVNRPTAGVTS